MSIGGADAVGAARRALNSRRSISTARPSRRLLALVPSRRAGRRARRRAGWRRRARPRRRAPRSRSARPPARRAAAPLVGLGRAGAVARSHSPSPTSASPAEPAAPFSALRICARICSMRLGRPARTRRVGLGRRAVPASRRSGLLRSPNLRARRAAPALDHRLDERASRRPRVARAVARKVSLRGMRFGGKRLEVQARRQRKAFAEADDFARPERGHEGDADWPPRRSPPSAAAPGRGRWPCASRTACCIGR